MNVSKNTIHYKRFLIPYRIYGSGETCLVCINGAQMSMGIWRPFITKFSKKYRVVIFDFPHQGAGEIISEPFHITFNEQIKCVEQVMNHITHYRSLHVFGASWGAVMAAAYATNNPGKVDKLILGSCAIKRNKKLNKIISAGLDYCSREEENKLGNLLISGFGESIPDSLKKKIEEQFFTINPRHLEAFCYQSRFLLKNHLTDIVDLSKITATTLIVYGDKDEVSDLADVYSLQDKIQGAELTIIKGIGHFLHLEDSSVMDVYDNFFASNSISIAADKYGAFSHCPSQIPL